MNKTIIEKNKYIILVIIAILIVKVFLAMFFSSDYQIKMFIPFVNSFLDGNNPYQFYFDNKLLASFPYPPAMLLIESVFLLIIRFFNINNIVLINLLFKMPIFIFDFVILVYLIKMGFSKYRVILLYYLSPVILYSSYMHGQLDIIPTAFLIISIYYLVSFRIKFHLLISSIFFGIALGTKLHIVAALPIVLIYLLQKRGFKYLCIYALSSLLVFLVLIIPFYGDGILNVLLFNKEQGTIFNVYIDYGVVRVIIPILLVVIIYYKAFDIKFFNKDLLISLLSFVFSIFLISVPSMPAWFVWVVPFLIMYICSVNRDIHKIIIIYLIFNIVYLCYFVFLHNYGFVDLYCLNTPLTFLKIDILGLKYLFFTILTATLLALMYKIYSYGLVSNFLYLRGNRLFTIGIAGDSGTGKSKMKEKINDLFGINDEVLYIEGDGDHKWERNDENWKDLTALNPRANFLYKQARDIHNLRFGNQVKRVDYNHDSGKFSVIKKITPKKYIVLCGLHSLYLPQLREELDLKIFMDTDEKLRKFWKIKRDTENRGWTKDKILMSLDERVDDAKKYIYPQRDYADIVLTYFDDTLKDYRSNNHNVVLSLKVEVDIMYDMELFIDVFRENGINIIQDQNYNKQILIFSGRDFLRKLDFEKIANAIITQYDDLFTYNPIWRDGIAGLVQVFVLYMISIKMKGDTNV